MKLYVKTIIVLMLLLTSSTSWGEANHKFITKFIENMNRDHIIFTVQKNTDLYLYTLGQLNEANTDEVKQFIEYMLDAIVCESWKNKDNLDPTQLKRTMQILQAIKEYRSRNPRVDRTQINPCQISTLFHRYNGDYLEQSEKILAELKPSPDQQ